MQTLVLLAERTRNSINDHKTVPVVLAKRFKEPKSLDTGNGTCHYLVSVHSTLPVGYKLVG